MAWSFRRWSNSPRVAGTIAGAVAAFCLVGALGTYQSSAVLRDRGERAAATVIEVHGGRTKWVRVRFTTLGGREVETDVYEYRWDPEPDVGDAATVLYDPEDPDVVVDARIGPTFWPSWTLAALGAFLAWLSWASYTRRILWSREGRSRRRRR